MSQTSPSRRAEVWTRVERLWQAALRITAEHELERVLDEIVESARVVLEARYAAIGILDETGGQLARFITGGLTDDQRARLGSPPTGHGVLGRLIRDPHPLRIKNLHEYAQAAGFPSGHIPMTSFLGVPIVGSSGPIGNLYVTDKMTADEFTPQDETLAVMLAAHAAVALENARYHADREQLMGELRQLQASRERFFAMTNHELRNALTAVAGWTELWIRKTAPNAPRAALEVQDSAERALTLLEDLLDLSRLDADKLEPIVTEFDAWRVVRESVATVEPAAERKGIRIAQDGAEGRVMVRNDAGRIRQILINLLTNAVRHSPRDDTIEVYLRAPDGEVEFTVVDHGEGIASEQQSIIFEAFERAGTQQERGTGLGLALSRKLARLLGGDLRVESSAGKGARFLLRLPRELSPL
jgi:signal transduction histidine kinase